MRGWTARADSMIRPARSLRWLWIAAALCWSAPFLTAPHTFPIPTFYAEGIAAACWIALAAAVLALTWTSRIPLPRIALAPLGLAAVLLAQLWVAKPLNPFFSWVAIAYLLAAAVACGLGARCRRAPEVLEAIAGALLIGGLLTVLIECLHGFRVPGLPAAFVSITPTGNARRMWGNLNQPNHAASYLACGLAACLFLAQKYRRHRMLLAVVTCGLLLGMALTFSRMSWLYLCLAGGMAGLAWATDGRGARRWLIAGMLCAALAALYQICHGLVACANEFWRLDLSAPLAERVKSGIGLRGLLWRHAWHMFLAHPWLGGGWGDYAWNQYVQTDTLGRVEMSLNAHNIVLDLLAKVGLIGGLAVAIPFIGLLSSARAWRLTPESAFLCTIILVMAVHSMLEYPLHYLFFLLPFVFALGYVDTRPLQALPGPLTPWLIGAVVAGGAALTLRMAIDYRSVEPLYYAAKGASQTAAERARASAPSLLAPYARLAIASDTATTAEAEPALAAIEQAAVQFYPGPEIVQRYALTLALAGRLDEAMLHVRRFHRQHWMDDARLLTQACAEMPVRLGAFCARLKSEALLTAADRPPGAAPSPAPP